MNSKIILHADTHRVSDTVNVETGCEVNILISKALIK